jgi:polar amino acid transport system substrate-binding protein
MKAPPAAVADLAPTGKLRAAINFGNPVLASKDAATGEAKGVSRASSRAASACRSRSVPTRPRAG